MGTMLDALNMTRLQAGLASVKCDACAGYIGGSWPDYMDELAAGLGIPVMSIAVASSFDADCLDVELGDATNATAPGWFQRQQARGSVFIVFYTSVSNANALVAALAAAGIPRSAYWLWTAHYDGAHICSPACYSGNAQTADATQWTSNAAGPCDQSVLGDAFLVALRAAKGYAAATAATPSPNPAPVKPAVSVYVPKEGDMVSYDPVTGGFWVARPDGSVFAFDGAPYCGGLNNHPAWGVGTAASPCVGIAPFGKDGVGGYVLVADTGKAGTAPAPYRMPRNGSLAK